MANFHHIFTNKNKLSSIGIKKGNFLTLVDNGEMYVDVNDTTRIKVGLGYVWANALTQTVGNKADASWVTQNYVSSVSLSGQTLTVVKNGVKSTFTTKDTTYGVVSASANGLMTPALLAKLNGIEAGANKYTYTLPTAANGVLGGVKTTSGVTDASGYTACPIIGGVPYYKDTNDTYTSLKNPYSLTLQFNGTNKVVYDGSSAKTLNITPAGIGASATSHTHNYLPLSGGTITGAINPKTTNSILLGSASLKYKAVYATTFYGALSGNATSATSATNATNATNATYAVQPAASNANNFNAAYVRGIRIGTTDLVAGSSALAAGEIYIVYEE